MADLKELIAQADRDPFYNKRIKSKEKNTKKKLGFVGYNWTTIKKAKKGQALRIKELKALEEPSDKEKTELNHLKALHRWATWAITQHDAGKSDKTIHAESQKGAWRS